MQQSRCVITGEPFAISDYEQEYCRKFDVPLPVIAPLMRLRRMAVFRNRSYLFHSVCAESGKKILSSIAPERALTVWDRDIWESDRFDPMAAGRDYDFSKPFFTQFEELFRQVPLPNLSINRPTMENSDFTNGITGAKNCYLIFSCSFCEDSLYSKLLYKCTNVVGSVLGRESQLCYSCSDIHRCYNLCFSSSCHDCFDSNFLHNCLSCKNCFGCVNLSHQQYVFFNEQLSKEAYFERVAEFDLGSHAAIQHAAAKFAAHRRSFPTRHIDGRSSENSTGQHINNSKNCRNCYSTAEGEDLEHCIYINNAVNSLFYFGYGNSSRGVYSSVTVGDSSENVRFSFECWPSVNDLEYCAYVHRGSNNCFGCVGLRKQSYCILNKQYSREQYRELVARIRLHMRSTGEYGKFFPWGCSPNYYNFSEGIDWMPLPREQAEQFGFEWLEPPPEPAATNIALPDHITDCDDSVLKTGCTCELTGKRFAFQRAELEFHRRMNIALPRLAPLERIRHNAEFLIVHPVHSGSCAKCGEAFETTRDQTRDTVFCESCFQKELI